MFKCLNGRNISERVDKVGTLIRVSDGRYLCKADKPQLLSPEAQPNIYKSYEQCDEAVKKILASNTTGWLNEKRWTSSIWREKSSLSERKVFNGPQS